MEQVREIYAVCHVNDVVKRRALGFVLAHVNDAGEIVPFPIVVTRQAGKFYAYVNRCPHQGTRLDFEPKQFLDPSLALSVVRQAWRAIRHCDRPLQRRPL